MPRILYIKWFSFLNRRWILFKNKMAKSWSKNFIIIRVHSSILKPWVHKTLLKNGNKSVISIERMIIQWEQMKPSLESCNTETLSSQNFDDWIVIPIIYLNIHIIFSHPSHLPQFFPAVCLIIFFSSIRRSTPIITPLHPIQKIMVSLLVYLMLMNVLRVCQQCLLVTLVYR